MAWTAAKNLQPCKTELCETSECCRDLTCEHHTSTCGPLHTMADPQQKCANYPCTNAECCQPKLEVSCSEQQEANVSFCGRKNKFKRFVLLSETRKCAGNPCKKQECCERSPNQHCDATAPGFCRIGTHRIKEAGNVVCSEFECGDRDKDRCCQSDGTCESVLSETTGFCERYNSETCPKKGGKPTQLVAIYNPSDVNCGLDWNGRDTCTQSVCCRPLTCKIADHECGVCLRLHAPSLHMHLP